MREGSKLKRIATVEVGPPQSWVALLGMLNRLQDVAEQVLAFVRMKSVSGQNMVLDGGLLSF